MQVKTNAILALTPSADQTLLEGYFVEVAAGVASVVNAATDIPLGVILDGEDVDGKSSIAVAGGFAGTCKVKLSGAVSQGDLGQLAADGTVITDSGAGARVIVCRFLEDGVADELVEAVIFLPDVRA